LGGGYGEWRADCRLPIADLNADSSQSAISFRECLRRPEIELEIVRCDSSAWKIFHRHHYLNGNLHRGAQCFVGLVEESPAAFVAVLAFPHPRHSGWREHRCVCLPDFQGVGIGNAMSEFVASLFAATGKWYASVTSHPAMMHHRARSAKWRMIRPPSRINARHRKGVATVGCDKTLSTRRITASFEFIGEPDYEHAERFGIRTASNGAGFRGGSPQAGVQRRH
jgi:hypothetical protein